MTEIFGPHHLRKALELALGGLRVRREQIDHANVYPVPDGDTGTNLVSTLEAVAAAAARAQDHALPRAVVEASTAGARGNSGVILAQWLRGLCSMFDEPGDGGPNGFRRSLKRAAEFAYQAMLNPREGTMLTVAAAAAEHAAGEDLAAMAEAAAAAGREALSKTPELLPVLRAEGVLDAGAIGMCVVLDAIASALSGREPAPLPAIAGARRVRPRESGSIEFAYEVQYLLDASDAEMSGVRERLGAIGDSVAVVGGDGAWNVHVHTNDPGLAIEIGMRAGRPRSISVVEFESQIAETRGLPVTTSAEAVAVFAVTHAPGFAELFRELGASVVADVRDVPRTHPSPIVLAAGNVPAPEDSDVLDAGDPARMFAALLAFAPSRDRLDNLHEMRAAIAAARVAEAGSIEGIAEAVAGLGDGEVVTVFSRERIDPAPVRDALGDLEVDVRYGGQYAPAFLVVLE